MSVQIGVRGKLFLVSFALLLVFGVSSSAYMEHELRSWFVSSIEDELLEHARSGTILVDQAASAIGFQYTVPPVDGLADRLGEAAGARVTIIRSDGKVLGDSELTPTEVEEVENHKQRPEIQEALHGSHGRSRRYSETLDEEMLYVAAPFTGPRGEGAVRAALPLSEVDATIWRLRMLIAVGGMIGLVIAAFMSGLASHLAVRPVRELLGRVHEMAKGAHSDDEARVPVRTSDELGGLAGSINRLAAELDETVSELAHERDRLEAILDSMNEGVIVIDDEGRLTLVNPSAVELFGLSLECLGDPLGEAIGEPVLQELFDEAESGGRPTKEFQIEEGEHERFLLARAAPDRASGGVVIVLHDVTELRRLETIRRDFVANISHELRTPVTVIETTAETLLDGAIDDPEHAPRFLKSLIRNAQRLSNILADLLDISRLESGHYGIEKEAVVLHGAVSRAMGAVLQNAEEKDISVRNAVDEDRVVEADVNALDQVLLNLLNNAVKYTDPGGSVVVRSREEEGGVIIEIEDDGVGIPPEDRDRIFERFYRVDSGRARNTGGSGLGLSIVKHLVAEMGGEVGYRPAEPEGSIFWFFLPRDAASSTS